MFRRLKYKLLQWLINDISKKIIKQRGYVFLQDARTVWQIQQLGMEAYQIKTKVKEETN